MCSVYVYILVYVRMVGGGRSQIPKRGVGRCSWMGGLHAIFRVFS